MRQLFIIAAVLSFSIGSSAFANCTTQNVAGTYGYVGFGNIGTNPFGLPAGVYSSTGTLVFDGKGGLLITDTARIDDFFLPADAVYPGTYAVDRQCVGTFTLSGFVRAGVPGPHYKFVLVNNRKGIRAISLVRGWIVNYVNTTRIDGEE
jgi:hypothetical protein